MTQPMPGHISGAKPTVVPGPQAVLGEGPSWDAQSQVLYWVDIESHQFHIFNVRDGNTRTVPVGQYIGAMVPHKRGGVVLALQRGIYHMDLESGEKTLLAEVEHANANMRFNDGKCDPAGRFWAGTMSTVGEPNVGKLYCLDVDGSIRVAVENVTTSNGLGWSPNHDTMYYIDTPTQQVWAYDYDLATGSISNRRVVVQIPGDEGSPDGMNVDAEGNLWVAHWGGSRLSTWNPQTGERLAEIRFPAERVTSCVFAGQALTDLYVTTARVGLSDGEAEKQQAGCLFHLNVGVKGSETYAYGH